MMNLQSRWPIHRLHLTTFFCLTIALLLHVANGLAQTSSQPFSSTYEVQKVPANPDVAQLGKFGDIPVNKYNGTANFAIPIYEIDFDGLKIPIELKYNTSGVRVEQEASWVGLGWSLSEGMTITREVNGYEDIYNFDHLNANSTGWIYSKDYLMPVWPDDLVTGEMSEPDLIELQQNWHGNQTPIDTEPDYFTVSLPSGSCKFTLPKIINNATILVGVVSDNKNFKVLYDRVNYTFEITDPSGFVYDFSVVEMSTGYGSFESNDRYTKTGVVAGILFPIFHARHMISSWRVSLITSPYGRELEFTYEDGFYFSYPHFSESHDILAYNYPEFLEPSNQQVIAPPMSGNLTAFNVKNLSLISGSFGSVDFVFSDRSDLVSKEDKCALSDFTNSSWNTYLIYGGPLIAKKVEQIVVRNKAAEVIKTANLKYSYFNSQWVGIEPIGDLNPATDPFECDVSYIRLKLDSVKIGDQKYKFEYNQPNSLPAKYSRSVDFWGFYNGISNYTKIPSFNRFYVNHPGFANNMHDEWHEFFSKVTGGNRSADINYGKIGNLQKITYPTGGYAILDYEAHKVTLSNVNYHPTEYVSTGSGRYRFTSLDSSSNYKYSYQYMKLAKTPSYSLYDYNTCEVSTSNYQPNVNFQVTETSFCTLQTYNVRINATITCSVGCGQASPSGRAVWIRNVNTGQEYNVYDHNSETTRILETTMNLPIGTYQLKTANWTQSSPTVVVLTTANITSYFSEPIPPLVDEEFEIGGPRVKSVSNYDADGAFISKSNYLYDQYVTETGQQVSNGKLMDELIFHSKAGNLFDYTAIDFLQNGGGNGAILSSDNKIRTNPSAGGSHFGYNLVREEKVDVLGNKLGQTVTEFTNKPNEYILKTSESLPKITVSSNYILYSDFHSTINDLNNLGFTFYNVHYGSVYILGARPITYDYLNGSVLSEKVYNQASSLIRETINSYNSIEVWTNPGAVGANAVTGTIVYYIVNGIIHFQPYRNIQYTERKLNMMQPLVSTTTREYLNGSQISSTTDNYYENPAHFLMTRSTTTNSEGNLFTTKYSYPKDLPAVPFMNDLVTKNQVTSPIIMERYKGTLANPYATLLEKVQTFYSNTNSITGDVLPKEVFTYNMGDVAGQQRVLYEKYSNYGTLIQYRKSNENISNALLWGHSKLLPIAQVLNATSDQVAFTSFEENSTDGGWENIGTTASESKTGTKCSNTGNTISKSGLPTGNYAIGFWAKLITGSSGTVTINATPITITDTSWKYYEVTKSGTSVSVANSNVYIDELRLHPVGAQMTSYTYKPLVGMTSQTDPNGIVRYFEYDSFGRLKLIKDDKGNILKSFNYHYKGQ